jgi:hypothetical protein
VDQKWKDALNVAAAEPPAWGAGGGGGKVYFQEIGRKEASKLAKAGAAAVHVTEAEGRRARQGDGGRACIFKGVMGCTGTHPPWFCRAFGKLPAKEREKLIVDNKLCPFCLLHDKDKACGAKQKPTSVACTTPGCKGRHAQKLHELLKDILREEGRVHVLQEDDGWEESEGAWELEEAEGMIVGAVRQESECSWPDACDAWAALDEEAEVGVYQVGVGEMETSRADREDEQFEAEGLLVEGEEREYVLELLMREARVKMCASVHPANTRPATFKSKRKRNLEKKLHKRARVAGEAAVKGSGKDERRVADGDGEKQAAHGMPCNPETKGGKAVGGERGRRDQSTTSLPTSGGECSA